MKEIGSPDWLDVDKDAIVDEFALLVFHGTTGECLQWLARNLGSWDEHYSAVVGCIPAVVTITEYRQMFGGK